MSDSLISHLRNEAILLACLLPFGCAPPQHWMRADNANQDAAALKQALADCDATAEKKGQDLDQMFGSESSYTALQKCMHDKGYTMR